MIDDDEELEGMLRSVLGLLKESTATPENIALVHFKMPSPAHTLAAVSSSFTSEQLDAWGASTADSSELKRRSKFSGPTPSSAECSLPDSARQELLNSAGSRQQILRLIKSQTVNDADLERDLTMKILEGVTLDPKDLKKQELVAYARVTSWLRNVGELWEDEAREDWRDAVMSKLWSQDNIQHRLRLLNLYEPFEMLVGDHFRGRQHELDILRSYVGALPARNLLERASRSVEKIFDLKAKPPLMIQGPGGMGKSTLIAKFILEHKGNVAFSFIDFDSKELNAAAPLTILRETIRQLSIQFPMFKSEIETLEESSGRKLEANQVLLKQFAKFVQASLKGFPLLLVIDTFEEAQYANIYYIQILWDFLSQLQKELPELRVVIAGRTELANSFPVKDLILEELDQKSARQMLESQGVEKKVAEDLVAKYGGNPLTLRLAVDIKNRDPKTILDGKAMALGLHGLVWYMEDEVIQALLYDRILKHIHDENVRKLAHPGLVLRKVTPELIKDVLAGPCELEVPNITAARALFAELKREISLVTVAGTETVKHRPDVRAIMLPLLKQSQKNKVKQIHESAIAYYEKHSDAASRAEEIYHRLCVGQSKEEIDRVWKDEAGALLLNSVKELPENQQVYLSLRLHLHLDNDLLSLVDDESWRMSAAMRMDAAIKSRRYEEALGVLKERPRLKKDPRLRILEIDSLRGLGQFEEASKICREGIRDIALTNSESMKHKEKELPRLHNRLFRILLEQKEWHEALLTLGTLELLQTLQSDIELLDVAADFDKIAFSAESIKHFKAIIPESRKSSMLSEDAILFLKQSTKFHWVLDVANDFEREKDAFQEIIQNCLKLEGSEIQHAARRLRINVLHEKSLWYEDDEKLGRAEQTCLEMLEVPTTKFGKNVSPFISRFKAQAHCYLADWALDEEDLSKAKQNISRAVGIIKAVIKQGATDHETLFVDGNSQTILAAIHRQAGRHAKAKKAYDCAIESYQSAVSADRSVFYLYKLAALYNELADNAIERENWRECQQYAGYAIDLLEECMNNKDADEYVAMDLGLSYRLMGDSLRGANKFAEAKVNYESSVAAFRSVDRFRKYAADEDLLLANAYCAQAMAMSAVCIPKETEPKMLEQAVRKFRQTLEGGEITESWLYIEAAKAAILLSEFDKSNAIQEDIRWYTRKAKRLDRELVRKSGLLLLEESSSTLRNSEPIVEKEKRMSRRKRR